MQRPLWLLAALASTALANGQSGFHHLPLSRREALQALPGVSLVAALPFDAPSTQLLSREQGEAQGAYLRTHPTSYTVMVQIGNRRERLFVNLSSTEESQTVNSLMAFVDTPRATPAQREALIRLATGFMKLCWPARGLNIEDSFWQQLLQQPWEKNLGWQTKQLGNLKLEWSGRKGLYPLGDHKTERAGLVLQWPKNAGRCTF